MNPLHWILLLALSLPSFAWARVRRVEVKPDQVVTVRTAIGIATIIQVPDRPNSIVVGDQAGFKVEYLDQAITIKPLRAGARSNLYIYTDWRRFNVQLVTAAESVADYVVYLDMPKEKAPEVKSNIHWMRFRNHLKNENVSMEVTRLGRTRDGMLIIEFKLKGSKKESFDPKWLWLTQSGLTTPIHRLFLSRLEVDGKESTEGMIQVLRADVKSNAPLRVEMRRKRMSYLTIPEVASWK